MTEIDVAPADAPRRLLIVDDHDGFRAAAAAVLSAEGFDVVGEAEDARSGIAAALALRPELVLVDVGLPDRDGFAVAAQLMGDRQPPAVVLTSTRDAADYGPLIASCGALGFVAKSELSGAALRGLVAA
jgi:DNA-binding NarL/FixJ family response regulator